MCEARLVFLLWAACAGRSEGRGEGEIAKDAPSPGAPTPPAPTETEATVMTWTPAVTLTACPDGSGDHTTLLAAIAAAPDGAIVEACGQVFSESLVIDGRDITLRGEPGTVLDLGGSDRGLEVSSATGPGRLRVEGVTITNGSADRGGAVLCDGAELILHDVVISASRASEGGGIAATNCNVRLVGVDVSTSSAVDGGGGGHLVGGTVAIESSRFGANEGGDGGGLLLDGVEGYVEDSVFEDNIGYAGAGLWFNGGVRIARNVLRRNAARFTGGGFAGKYSTGEILDNEVYENSSELDGGGGYTSNCTGHIAGNSFHDNFAGDDAGGLRMFFGMALVEHNLFVANTATNAAGAMKISHAEGEVRANVFEDNVAGTEAGALEIDDDVSYSTGNVFRRNHAGTDGGGVHLLKPRWHLRLDDTVFEDNRADACGGGLAMAGVDWGEPHTLLSQRLVFTGNRAARGGGACIQGGALQLDNAVFSGNQASADAGGLLVEAANVTLRNAVFHGNQAEHGSALAFSAVGDARVSEIAVVANPGESVSVDATTPVWRYNLQVGAIFAGMDDPVGRDGNFTGDPAFVDPAAGNFRLGAGSAATDKGDPNRKDADGSRVDVGAFGGPEGSGW